MGLNNLNVAMMMNDTYGELLVALCASIRLKAQS